MEQNLESLINDLANCIKAYPEADKQKISELIDQIEANQQYRQHKQPFKDLLLRSLGYRIENNLVRSSLKTIASSLIFLCDLGVKKEDFDRIVTRLPPVLASAVETIKLRVKYLKEIGVKEGDVGKVVTRLPAVLEYDVETMELRVKYLKEIGVKEGDIGKVVTRLPAVLGYDVEDNIKPKYNYVAKEGFGVGDVIAFPNVFSCDIKRIISRFEFLKLRCRKRYSLSRILAPKDEAFAVKVAKTSYAEYQTFLKDLESRFSNEAKKKSSKALAEWYSFKDEFLSRWYKRSS